MYTHSSTCLFLVWFGFSETYSRFVYGLPTWGTQKEENAWLFTFMSLRCGFSNIKEYNYSGMGRPNCGKCITNKIILTWKEVKKKKEINLKLKQRVHLKSNRINIFSFSVLKNMQILIYLRTLDYQIHWFTIKPCKRTTEPSHITIHYFGRSILVYVKKLATWHVILTADLPNANMVLSILPR